MNAGRLITLAHRVVKFQLTLLFLPVRHTRQSSLGRLLVNAERIQVIIRVLRLLAFIDGHEEVPRILVIRKILHAPVGISGIYEILVQRLCRAVGMHGAENHVPGIAREGLEIILIELSR